MYPGTLLTRFTPNSLRTLARVLGRTKILVSLSLSAGTTPGIPLDLVTGRLTNLETSRKVSLNQQ